MQLLSFSLLFIALLVSLSNWRYGIMAIIVIGVLQDVLRKLTPGAPGYYIIFSALVFICVFVSAWARGATTSMKPLYLRDSKLRAAWIMLFVIVLIQSGHALVRWGNPFIPVLGMMTYLGPIAALLVGAAMVRSE